VALRSFAVDRVTAEVTAALSACSIDSILLKGPTIATWLYAHGQPRLYSDTDLLIRQTDWERARSVVQATGFRDALGPLAHPRMESGAGHSWKRERDGAEIDLHITLFGLGADPDRVWSTFSERTEVLAVGGRPTVAMGKPARLLHISLHAIQHGGERQVKPMVDLQRALTVASPGDWARAARLARSLDGLETFGAGLSLLPEGRRVVEELRIPCESLGVILRLDATPMAEGFEEVARTGNWRGRLRLMAREAVPSREFMRWWTPLARRGRAALVLSYVWRNVWLLSHAVPGFVSWRRARARAGGVR
jgi:hypothetical protein